MWRTCAIAALLILAHATPPAARAGSGFWAEPYTVISVVIIAAAARRAWTGALAAGCLAGAYLLGVLSASPGPPAAGSASVTAAWVNASCPLSSRPFTPRQCGWTTIWAPWTVSRQECWR